MSFHQLKELDDLPMYMNESLQGLSQSGPTIRQYDLFELIAMSRWVNSNSQAANNLSNRVTVGASSKISSAYNIT